GAARRGPVPSAEGAALPRLRVSRFEIDAHRLFDLAQPQRQRRQRLAHGQGDRPDADLVLVAAPEWPVGGGVDRRGAREPRGAVQPRRPVVGGGVGGGAPATTTQSRGAAGAWGFPRRAGAGAGRGGGRFWGGGRRCGPPPRPRGPPRV